MVILYIKTYVEKISSNFKLIMVTSKYSTDETSSSVFTIASDITSLDPSTASVSIISTVIPTSTIIFDITSLDPSRASESIISINEISSNLTTTNLITSDISPMDTPIIQDNNHDNLDLSYFVVSPNVSFSEKYKNILNTSPLKKKETKCDENCLLLELAIIELSNEIKDII
eukprot:jgi/Orpsp1_1/1187501/evm.model.d7180000058190.1